MPVTRPLAASPASARPEHAHEPKPFGGWAMVKAAALDRAGARGLVADLLTASTLRRQAAFVVCATVNLDEPSPFLALVEPSRPTRLIAIRRKTARLRAAHWS